MPSSSLSLTSWQNKLFEACQGCNIDPPSFEIFSDRRGGRTAWTSRVLVYGSTFEARFWYDGKNIDNAREDAAEQAVTWLTGGGSISSSPLTSQSW
ncbi:hypothetical protein CMQ_996 [Grosmannia clavigera kw1407]|uniref:DRBM domain-containing protein n=1 Tax=Grosmannia clavigera (strain kw1407 / UAMH 11150) TaxID=655863 RepID=F0XBX6_GROCL|nr:uncharacterized protein CMQ_996 [Grosmannia clavigera kw1407]EFX04068.1 hypothetical protein CMQ_996 [Grosmannia clavigera kw1407]